MNGILAKSKMSTISCGFTSFTPQSVVKRGLKKIFVLCMIDGMLFFGGGLVFFHSDRYCEGSGQLLKKGKECDDRFST